MTPSTPPPLPAMPGGPATRWRIPPRKLILSVILVASILFFFLILFASIAAILLEAAFPGHRGHVTAQFISHIGAVKHFIAHQILHLIQPRHK